LVALLDWAAGIMPACTVACLRLYRSSLWCFALRWGCCGCGAIVPSMSLLLRAVNCTALSQEVEASSSNPLGSWWWTAISEIVKPPRPPAL